MFTGIIECTSNVLSEEPMPGSIQWTLSRPHEFTDLKIGDSIAVNGVCLTVEQLTDSTIIFRLGAETLRVLGGSLTETHDASVRRVPLNLERALLVGARLHGHWVTGHVDGMGQLLARRPIGDCLELDIEIPLELKPFVWNKGSITLNGVSLTINKVINSAGGPVVQVCLIPETLRRTNLSLLEVGQSIAVESDYYAKAVVQSLSEMKRAETEGTAQ